MKMSKQHLEVKLHLLEAAAIVREGGQQVDVRKKFGDTLGQKLWFILLLDKRFPKVELVKRLTELEPHDPKFIKFSAVSGSNLPMLAMRSDPKALEEHSFKMQSKGQEPYSELTEEKFEAFLTSPIATPANTAKMMSKDNLHNLVENFPINLGRDVAKAILDNDVRHLDKYMSINAETVNKIIEALIK